MHVTVLVPAIHDLPTGGNVYNRRIVEAWPIDGPVQIVSWALEERPVPAFDLPAEGVVVVDSLLARDSGTVRALRAAHPTATIVLLVHYLHCIDPTAETSEVAAAERAVLEGVDGAITTSRFARTALVEEGVPADRVWVVPPGLDAQYHAPLPVRPARTVPRMLTVANLVPEKGLQSFVDVLADLRSMSWAWTLVGDASLDPDYAAGLLARIGAARLSERVTFTGSLSPAAVRRWYDRSDLFVLPSRFETRSLSMREAMARGLPVGGYRVGGVEENFGDATAGRLVPPETPSALRSALRSLLTDPLARGRMGRSAWLRSQDFPNWEAAANQFCDALEALHAPLA